MKYLAMIICALAWVSCKEQNATQKMEQLQDKEVDNMLVLREEQLETLELDNVNLEKAQVSGTLQLNGKVDVDPDYKVSLSSALGGRIQSVHVLPGEFVRKGQIVLTIEDQQFVQVQQDYLTTEAQLLSAEPNYRRQKELNSNKSSSDRAMQEAETAYKSLLAVKNGLEEKLRLIHIEPSEVVAGKIQRSIQIRAPFSGKVSKVMVNKGKYVSASDELVELIDPKGFLLDIRVFEKDLPIVKVGQELQVFTNSNPDKKVTAKVITKGSDVQEDGSTEVIARLSDGNALELVNGLYINAVLTLEELEAYTLPEEAIVSYEGNDYVLEQLEKNRFRLQKVEVGDSMHGRTAVVNYDSLLNKRIINKGAYALLMAAKNTMEEE